MQGIKDFRRYADVLRKLGNFRHSYVICIEDSKEQLANDDHSIFAKLDAAECFVTSKHTTDEILANVLTSESDIILLVISDFRTVISRQPEILSFVNELHIKGETLPLISRYLQDFAEITNDNNSICLKHNVLRYDQTLVVMPSKNFMFTDFDGKHIKLEPYHLLAYDAKNKFCIAYIWDTREIVGIETELTENRIAEICSLKHENDSSRLLYIYQDAWNKIQDEQVRVRLIIDYLGGIIENY